MKTQLVTGPALNPVSLVEVKAHLNLQSSFTTDDTLLNAQILTAVDFAESFTYRRLISQTWKLFLDGWAGIDTNRYFIGGFYLPFGQLQSVTHIKYTDTDEDQTTWTAATYYDVDIYNEPGRVVLAYNQSFPTASLYPTNPIEIQFVCGWYQGDLYAVSTGYLEDAYVVPTTGNGFVYQAGGDGTSHSSEPTWPKTIGGTVVDNDITWTNAGQAVPNTIKQAILLSITEMYSIREVTMLNVSVQKLRTIENLLNKSKLWEF